MDGNNPYDWLNDFITNEEELKREREEENEER